jgi:hypothetical protein
VIPCGINSAGQAKDCRGTRIGVWTSAVSTAPGMFSTVPAVASATYSVEGQQHVFKHWQCVVLLVREVVVAVAGIVCCLL